MDDQNSTLYLHKITDYPIDSESARTLVSQIQTAIDQEQLARFGAGPDGQVPVLAFRVERDEASLLGDSAADVWSIYCVPEDDRNLRLRVDMHLGNARAYVFAVLTEEEYEQKHGL